MKVYPASRINWHHDWHVASHGERTQYQARSESLKTVTDLYFLLAIYLVFSSNNDSSNSFLNRQRSIGSSYVAFEQPWLGTFDSKTVQSIQENDFIQHEFITTGIHLLAFNRRIY